MLLPYQPTALKDIPADVADNSLVVFIMLAWCYLEYLAATEEYQTLWRHPIGQGVVIIERSLES